MRVGNYEKQRGKWQRWNTLLRQTLAQSSLKLTPRRLRREWNAGSRGALPQEFQRGIAAVVTWTCGRQEWWQMR
jgi:hypothetical protein